MRLPAGFLRLYDDARRRPPAPGEVKPVPAPAKARRSASARRGNYPPGPDA